MIVERLDPETTEDSFQRALHLERYRWAKERLAGRRVLDAACGLGYGSAILAEGGGREVLGVDRDEGALATARARHAGEGVRFERVMDLLLPEGPLAGAGRYDTIVSLETLEHLDRPVAFLRQAHRLLAPGGRLVLSAPVKERPGENPFHLHCFTAATLQAVALEGFTKEDELLQANGAYLTLALKRKEAPCPAWLDRHPEEGGYAPARATLLLVTWNSQERVIELVRALRTFTSLPYELLVIDNASTDGVASFLELYRGEPGYRLVRNPENTRLAAATNQGLALCETEYLVYLCASHALVTEPGWLGRLLGWIDERPEVALAGDVWAPGYSLPSKRYRPGWTPDPAEPPGHVQGGAWIARPSVLLERGGFAENEHPHVGMDLELSHRLLSWGEALGNCPLVRSPAWPQEPELGEAVVYHPASAAVRARILARIEGRAEPLPGGETPRFPDEFQPARGQAEPLPGGLFRVRAQGPDSGLFSRERFRDVRVRAKVRYSGQAILKVRQGSPLDPVADGYHVLLGGGTDYLARNDQVLARLPSSPGAIDLELLVQGHELTVCFDGREVARVTDQRLASPGHVLLGANRGEAIFGDLVLEPLDVPAQAGEHPSGSGQATVHDCFLFFNELDALEIRLEELDSVVDRFVLVEATTTFTGQPKPLVFAENKARFARFLPRIEHVVVEDLPGEDAWAREAYQRNAILRGLEGAAPDDVVLISDVDEVPRAETVRRFLSEGMEAAALLLRFYYYRLNCQNTHGSPASPWNVIARRRLLRAPQAARESRDSLPFIPDAGWHFSYLGDERAIRAKIQAFSHQELNLPQFTDEAEIARRMRLGLDLFDRPGLLWRFVPLDESFPRHVRANEARFRHLIAAVSGEGGLSTASETAVVTTAGDSPAPSSSDVTGLGRSRESWREPGAPFRGAAIVFSELLPNESFCASIVRELGAFYEVRPCGPGWPAERLSEVDPNGVAFYLELDAASGSFVQPEGLERLQCPKFAWLIDTHKKIEFHRQIAREVDLTFYAHRAWGHVFDRPAAWLPLHADQEIFRPQECLRDLDLVFVGSQAWRADPLRRLAERHGLRVEIATTAGPREKSETAALYARARLVFNKNVTNDLNFRVFEATAAGRVLLTDAQWNGQYELFEEDRHLVYYKDERDLERQVLRLLGDEELRGRIEREAAAWTQAHHTTRARVGQLVQAIEVELAQRRPRRTASAAEGPPPAVPTSSGGSPARLPRVEVAASPRMEPRTAKRARWLILAGPEPEAVWLASWAERLATVLSESGQEVVLARERRTSGGPLGQDAQQPGVPRLFELERGPLPAAPTPANDMLAGAAPLQRRLSQLMASEGPFDFLLAEGALGALVGPPLAARSGVPFLFLLPDCEVLRRGNQLTREQLYLAELEHWGAERAARVLVPRAEVALAARQHYRVADPLVCPVPAVGSLPPGGDALLLERLGLPPGAGEEGRPVLVLGSDLGPAERDAVLGAGLARPLLFAGEGLSLACPGSAPVRLAREGPRGPALGALLRSAQAVLLADRLAERQADAERLARRLGRIALKSAGAREALDRGLAEAREAGSSQLDLAGLVATLVAARAPGLPVRGPSSPLVVDSTAPVALAVAEGSP